MDFQTLLKRSSVQGQAPTTSQIGLGELALNTYEGVLYLKTNVNGSESIVSIGGPVLALATPRTISLTGQASGATAFDGTHDVNLTVSIASTGITPGTYNSFVVDGTGRIVSGTNSTLGVGTLFLSGDALGSGSTTVNVSLASTGVTLGSYSLVSVDTKGRVVAASNPSAVFTGVLSGTGNHAGASLTLSATGISPGSYYKVTVQNDGRIYAGTTLGSADISQGLGYLPAISTALAWTTTPVSMVGTGLTVSNNTLAMNSGWSALSVSAIATALTITNSTLKLVTIAASSLLGNSAVSAAVPSAIAIGSGMSLSSSTLKLATIPAANLFGNSAVTASLPAGIAIGSGLSLSAGTLVMTGSVAWTAVHVSSVGQGLVVTSGTLTTTSWAASAVSMLGAGMTVSAGTLALSNVRWGADSVALLSNGLTISSGTLSLTTMSAASLLGNAAGSAAVPSAIVVGSGLSLGNTSVALATLAAGKLFGNSASSAAVPGAIALGTGLSLSAGTLVVTSTTSPWKTSTVTAIGNGLTVSTGALALSSSLWTAGTVSSLGYGLTVSAGTMSLSGGSWTAASVTTVGAGAAVTAGTLGLTAQSVGTLLGNVTSSDAIPAAISVGGGLLLNGGTLAMAPIAANQLLGNSAASAAAPTAIALGTGLSLSSGTLAFTGGLWGAAAVATVGSGLTVSSSTLNLAGGAWTATAVSALDSGLTVTTGTLALTSNLWTADSVTTIDGSFATVSNGTLGLVAIRPGSFLSEGGSIPIGSGLTFTDTTLGLHVPLPTNSLLGNPGTSDATPAAVGIGSGLSVSSGTLIVATTTSASWTAAPVDSLVDALGVTSGTLGLTSLPPQNLLGNAASSTTSAIGIGAGVSLVSGTLIASPVTTLGARLDVSMTSTSNGIELYYNNGWQTAANSQFFSNFISGTLASSQIVLMYAPGSTMNFGTGFNSAVPYNPASPYNVLFQTRVAATSDTTLSISVYFGNGNPEAGSNWYAMGTIIVPAGATTGIVSGGDAQSPNGGIIFDNSVIMVTGPDIPDPTMADIMIIFKTYDGTGQWP